MNQQELIALFSTFDDDGLAAARWFCSIKIWSMRCIGILCLTGMMLLIDNPVLAGALAAFAIYLCEEQSSLSDFRNAVCNEIDRRNEELAANSEFF